MALLSGVRVVEGSAFVAAPLGGLTLAQLGADVIRFDRIGGGLDYRRWPVVEGDVSLYWAGLNKGKRSIALDLGRPEGRELATALIVAPGDQAGLFLSNFPESGWLSDARLRERRPDLVYVNIIGSPDGSSEVDYTVNAASGIALATGTAGSALPLNNALPAWDIATGLHAVIALLAAERARREGGGGQLVKIALADVAFATVANLGFLGQAEVLHENRPPLGNDMYGAFGRDFASSDGRRVMVVAISLNQWQSLVAATGIADHLPAMERAFEADLSLEGDRYRCRDAIAALIAPWFAARPLDVIRTELDEHGVCWGPYQTFTQALSDDWRASDENPIFSRVHHPGLGDLLTPASPLTLDGKPPLPPASAPRLGMHTDEVLSDVLGLSSAEIGRLHDEGLVAGSDGVG
ncbi:MAG TPA: CoA transferase [Acidimicrobiia bacterium]|nr:CoA transferase [Acidimicrobiia bacterium]